MATLKINIPHNKTEIEALKLIKNNFKKIVQQNQDKINNLKVYWQKNSCLFSLNTYGYDIEGILIVKENSINIEGGMPFAVSLFKNKIIKIIKEKVIEILK